VLWISRNPRLHFHISNSLHIFINLCHNLSPHFTFTKLKSLIVLYDKDMPLFSLSLFFLILFLVPICFLGQEYFRFAYFFLWLLSKNYIFIELSIIIPRFHSCVLMVSSQQIFMCVNFGPFIFKCMTLLLCKLSLIYHFLEECWKVLLQFFREHLSLFPWIS